MGYLDDIPGLRDVRANGGAVLARRNVVDFRGARAVDDPVNGATNVYFDPAYIVSTPLSITDGIQIANDDAHAYLLSHAGITLNGIGSPELVKSYKYRIWIINDEDVNLGLAHDVGAILTSRFVTPTGLTLQVAPQGLAAAIWQPSIQRWRVY